MREVCSLIWLALVGAFRSRASLEAENMILRHQLNVLQRKSSKRPTFATVAPEIRKLIREMSIANPLWEPSPRTIHAVDRIVPTPFLGGLHQQYVRF
jgi:hypothetical protein